MSHIPRPANYGESPQKTLSELPPAATNARDGSRKHHISNLPEPAAKRKTLAERGGEPLYTKPTAPPSREPVYPSITSRATSVSSSHSTTFKPSFSQSYRDTSGQSTRNTSGSSQTSFSSSVSSNMHQSQPTKPLARAKTTLANNKALGRGALVPRPPVPLSGPNGKTQDGQRKDPFSQCSRSLDSRAQPFPMRSSVRDIHDERMMPPPITGMMRPTATPMSRAQGRDTSITTVMRGLSLEATSCAPQEPSTTCPASPSKLPRPVIPSRPPLTDEATCDTFGNSFNLAASSSVIANCANLVSLKSPFPSIALKHSSPPKQKRFLTKHSELEHWDTDENYSNMEQMYNHVCKMATTSMNEATNMREVMQRDRVTIATLEDRIKDLTEKNVGYRIEAENSKHTVALREQMIDDLKRTHSKDIEHVSTQHQRQLEHVNLSTEKRVSSLNHDHRLEIEKIKTTQQEEVRRTREEYETKVEEERALRISTVAQASTAGETFKQQQQAVLDQKDQEIQRVALDRDLVRAQLIKAENAQTQLEQKMVSELDSERQSKLVLQQSLQQSFNVASTTIAELEAKISSLLAKVHYLESDQKSQSESYAAIERDICAANDRAEAADARARKLEIQRRKLHDEVQNLKGNIQVMCRQRPALDNDGSSAELAAVTYPDTEEMKQIEVRGLEEKSSLGNITTKRHPFTFDKAFSPYSSNNDVFQEIEPLIQSAIDGYNVCIFAYGQTGSGKTHTMSSSDGVMPQAIQKIYDTTKQLEETGWKYTIQGSFVEVYNENINDLLGDPSQVDKKKHEVRHDMHKCETTITDITLVELDSQDTVANVVDQAMARRSVAATKMNERSSRSHSVFILRLCGQNTITGESSKGTLNLVDLAGSERVSRSKVEGDRLKETQNINKSLSCLGDVIGALGAKEPGAHIPYRNSKLTYLLQFSLGGNSKTLMFVMVSPLKEHLGETLTSLKFATKVHNTHIGTAKKAGK